MGDSADAIALLERLLDLATDSLDNARIVAANPRAWLRHCKVDVLPIGGIDADSCDLGEDVVVVKLGDRDVLDGRLALLDVYKRFCRCRNRHAGEWADSGMKRWFDLRKKGDDACPEWRARS